MQLYKLPTGADVSLYDHPMFAPVKWCPKHGQQVAPPFRQGGLLRRANRLSDGGFAR